MTTKRENSKNNHANRSNTSFNSNCGIMHDAISKALGQKPMYKSSKDSSKPERSK